MRVIEKPLAGFRNGVVRTQCFNQIVPDCFEDGLILAELRQNSAGFGARRGLTGFKKDSGFARGAERLQHRGYAVRASFDDD